MENTVTQKRFIYNKTAGFSVIKGKTKTGKTFAALNRAVNLENNYCVYNDDKILYITSDEKMDNVKATYRDIQKENIFYSLFSSEENKVQFLSSEKLINNNIELSSKECLIKLHNDDFAKCIFDIRRSSKFMKDIELEFLAEELLWINSWDFNEAEYLIVNRKLRPYTLRKNSSARRMIYNLFVQWKDSLNKSYSSEYTLSREEKFTHIIIDDSNLTYKMIMSIVKLRKEVKHSSIVIVLNSDYNNFNLGKIVVQNKKNCLYEDNTVKRFNFKRTFEIKEEKVMNDFIDKFQYINFSYNNKFNFQVDSSATNKEIITDDEQVYNHEELRAVPLFSDIAAGMPIEINEDETDEFYLPKSWVKRSGEIFMLHVKGDSMIDKNIHDGDLIVIQKQASARDNDIVAANVDGEATLKILKTKGKVPKLVPANDKYSPIDLYDKEVHIFGVAIGIIKKK